ncbi:MAG: hypothetical protein AAB791_00140 [Patescibacteria group bacterium]
MKSGELIVIDGGDGSGKHTQTKMLIKRLRQETPWLLETMDFPQYKEPFYGPVIKDYLGGRFGNPTKTDPMLASMPYVMNRYAVLEKLNDLLAKNAVVILDRYTTANYIHQGAKIADPKKRMEFIRMLQAIEYDILKLPIPSMVIYLHVKPSISLRLTKNRNQGQDGHESNAKYVRRTEKTALWLFENFPNWQLIECCNKNGIMPPEEIHEIVYEIASNYLSHIEAVKLGL